MIGALYDIFVFFKGVDSQTPSRPQVLDLVSVESLAAVLLPASVHDHSDHAQDEEPEDGKDNGEEQLDATHSLLLHLH